MPSKVPLSMAFPNSFRRKVQERVGHHLLFKDQVYMPEDWARQKTWRRFMPEPITSLRVLWGFSSITVALTIAAICICLYHAWLENVGAPKFWDKSQNLWQPFSLSSFCLALLLVHRTTASYNRWWEARTVWGSMLNLVRNLVRQAASWGFPQEEKPLLEMLARWVIAMPYLLKGQLRADIATAKAELESVLLPEELEYLFEAPQPCMRCAQVVSAIVGRAMPGEGRQQERVWMDEQVTLYVNNVGACERIMRTPIPIAFTRHLTRFLLVWLLLLPFALWPLMGWATPAVEAVLAFLLIGTENIGIQVEQPFEVLAMDAFCKNCEVNILELMETYKGASCIVQSIQQSGRAAGFRRREADPVGMQLKQLTENGVTADSRSSSYSASPLHANGSTSPSMLTARSVGPGEVCLTVAT